MDQNVCNEYLMMVAAIKVILKNRKITYKTLGEIIGSSEHAIKYALTKKDGSISTLVSICDALDMTFYDLAEYTKKTQGRLSEFNQKQEEYFLSSPIALRFFLDIDLMGVQQSAGIYALTEKKTRRYLMDFEKLGLLERLNDKQIRFLVKPPYRFSEKISNLVAKSQLEDMLGFLSKQQSPNYGWVLDRYLTAFTTLNSNQVKALLEELSKILEELIHKGYIQRTTGAAENLNHYSFFFGITKRENQERQ